MDPSKGQFTSIDEYINSFPEEVRDKLRSLRDTIKEEVPEAGEAIKYRMPTFTLHGNLIHFAAFRHHIGLYPAPTAIEEFREELARYKTSKGAIQFPLEQPLPLPLIRKIVRFRVEETKKRGSKSHGR